MAGLIDDKMRIYGLLSRVKVTRGRFGCPDTRNGIEIVINSRETESRLKFQSFAAASKPGGL